MDQTSSAVVSTFFQIGGAIGFGLFLFGVLPTIALLRFWRVRR